MKYLLFAVSFCVVQILAASNFNNYQQHIAKDRLLVIFHPSVSAEKKAELIEASGVVTSSVNIPSPSLTICFVSNYDQAQKYFSALRNEVKFVSFFLTDGKHYAGVLNQFFVKLRDKNFEPFLIETIKKLNLEQAVPDKYIPNLYLIRNSPSYISTTEWCRLFEEVSWVEYASPDYLLNPLVCTNDPLFARQWNIKNTGSVIQGNGTPDADMDVDSAWLYTTGSPNIKVAIIDSGVDTLQADLVASMLPGHDAVSDSTDGYPTPRFPNDGHGTCCAGIVAATKDNNIGITGVAPDCKIVPVRAFYYVEISQGAEPVPFSTAAIFSDAIGWSWSVAGADILSNSWGLPPNFVSILPGGTQPVDDAIQQAYTNGRNGKGVSLFFSSGNDNDSIGSIWPGSLPQSIAVNASSMCDERKSPDDCSSESWGGNFGYRIDFSAPGVKIPATDITGMPGFTTTDYYPSFNGTSAACPNAAAVGALILSLRPDLDPEDIRSIIAQTCDKVEYAYDSSFANGTWCRELGYGRVNAYRAVEFATIYSSSNALSETTQMSIYPNPATDKVFINYNNNQPLEVSLYDLSGRRLMEQTLQQNRGYVDVSILPVGLYIIKSQGVAKRLSIVR